MKIERRDGARIVEWRLTADEIGPAVETAGHPVTVQIAGEFHGATVRVESALSDSAPFELARTRQGWLFSATQVRLASLDTPLGLVRPHVVGGGPDTEVMVWLMIGS